MCSTCIGAVRPCANAQALTGTNQADETMKMLALGGSYSLHRILHVRHVSQSSARPLSYITLASNEVADAPPRFRSCTGLDHSQNTSMQRKLLSEGWVSSSRATYGSQWLHNRGACGDAEQRIDVVNIPAPLRLILRYIEPSFLPQDCSAWYSAGCLTRLLPFT